MSRPTTGQRARVPLADAVRERLDLPATASTAEVLAAVDARVEDARERRLRAAVAARLGLPPKATTAEVLASLDQRTRTRAAQPATTYPKAWTAPAGDQPRTIAWLTGQA